jgi:serine-type D-Ala-D-Ala carboxypeptidase/endopeptidase (penicillin-binding protein 4)
MSRPALCASALAFVATITCVCALSAPAAMPPPPPLVTPTDGGAAWSTDDRAALSADLDALFRDAAAIRGAHVGLYAVEATHGSPLYSRASDDEFMPASTLKLLVGTVALAWAAIGPEFSFRTDAFVTGPISNGELNGALVLRGGGDPFLRASDMKAMAAAVAAAGIRSIARGVLTESSWFDAEPYPPGWVWDDFPFYYAPVVSATSFEENVVHLTITPGAKVGDPARVDAAPIGEVAKSSAVCVPTRGVVVIPRAVTSDAGTESSIDVDRLPGGCIAVVGKIPRYGHDTVDAAVPSPEDYARDALVSALNARGIAVKGAGNTRSAGSAYVPAASDLPRIIWTHYSEPLPKLLTDLWFPSDNLLAELLLKSFGLARSGFPGTTENGVAEEREYLALLGVDLRTVTLRDGSGLSIYNRITPRDLVTILQADWQGQFRSIVLDALPVAGVRGTLREEFVGSGADGRAFVKTGSMSHVRGLAGFLATKRHGTVTFSLMVDDWNGVASELDAFRGAVLVRLIDA